MFATERTAKFNIVKRINTNNAPFSKIIYLYRDSHKILIENPATNKAYHISDYELGNVLKYIKNESQWTKTLRGDFIKINEDNTENVVKLNDSPVFVNMSYKNKKTILLPVTMDSLEKLEQYKKLVKNEKNFKLDVICKIEKSMATLTRTHFNYLLNIQIDFRAPLFVTWVHIGSDEGRKYIYFKIGKDFYKFPYGNVDSNNMICMPLPKFNRLTVESIFLNLINTQFNDDHYRHIKFDKIYDIDGDLLPVTYDLDYINKTIHNSTNNDREKLSFIDVLYYLSNVTELDNFPVEKLFLKNNNPEWIDEVSTTDIKKILYNNRQLLLYPNEEAIINDVILRNISTQEISLGELLHEPISRLPEIVSIRRDI